MHTKLLVVRHGNTFGPDETPLRVGGRTDIPLVESGRHQARCLGLYLKHNDLIPDFVFSASLKRARQTAELALEAIQVKREIKESITFNEIDYGPDENCTEEEVISRIGKDAIEQWNLDATVPEGWNVDPEKIIEGWHQFATMCRNTYPNSIVMVTTSNGIARFAPHLTGDFSAFAKKHPIKISTGGLCLFTLRHDTWDIDQWNVKPANWVKNMGL
jgi:2,3-bisphosphoglycerate-dependent phosphoglycerate mutase